MMTQEELADKAKLSKRTIERIEKGAPAQKSSLKLIAVALGLDPVSLIEGATPASIFDPMSKQGDRIFSGLETQEISPDDVETTRPPELTDQQRYSERHALDLYPNASDIIVHKLTKKPPITRSLLEHTSSDTFLQELISSKKVFIGPGTTLFFLFQNWVEKKGDLIDSIESIYTTNALITKVHPSLANKISIIGDTLLPEYYSYYFESDESRIPEISKAIIGISGCRVKNGNLELRTCWAEQVDTLRRIIFSVSSQVEFVAIGTKLLSSEGNRLISFDEMKSDCQLNSQKSYRLTVAPNEMRERLSDFDTVSLQVSQNLEKTIDPSGIIYWQYGGKKTCAET